MVMVTLTGYLKKVKMSFSFFLNFFMHNKSITEVIGVIKILWINFKASIFKTFCFFYETFPFPKEYIV